MSQRQFTSGKNTILTGWDRPLQYFFLVIENMDDVEAENDDYVFTNLNLPNPAMTIEQIKEVLSKLNITPPTTDDSDKKNNNNAFHNYEEI